MKAVFDEDFKKVILGEGDMALQFRALATLAQAPGLIPSTHTVAHNSL